MLLHGTLIAIALLSLSGVALSIYKTTVEENKNEDWKYCVFIFLIIIIAYFIESSMRGFKFTQSLAQFSLTSVFTFGIILPGISLLFKGDKKIMGMIMSFVAIPFSIICLVLSLFGAIHWLFPVLYFAIPLVIFIVCMIVERVAQKTQS